MGRRTKQRAALKLAEDKLGKKIVSLLQMMAYWTKEEQQQEMKRKAMALEHHEELGRLVNYWPMGV